jgi:hypothetical protein
MFAPLRHCKWTYWQWRAWPRSACLPGRDGAPQRQRQPGVGRASGTSCASMSHECGGAHAACRLAMSPWVRHAAQAKARMPPRRHAAVLQALDRSTSRAAQCFRWQASHARGRSAEPQANPRHASACKRGTFANPIHMPCFARLSEDTSSKTLSSSSSGMRTMAWTTCGSISLATSAAFLVNAVPALLSAASSWS